MIRDCARQDFDAMAEIINDAAAAYRGVIPDDCWHEPYMPAEELRGELDAGVGFRGWQQDDGPHSGLHGVMGVQRVRDVVLIRHAYVRTAWRNRGIGSELLDDLISGIDAPVLIGTWAAAGWAVRFYEMHGFRLTTPDQKNQLLHDYWTVSDRQIETSVVLADARWFAGRDVAS
jgi:GNAT superfamily N-acetyltransferase